MEQLNTGKADFDAQSYWFKDWFIHILIILNMGEMLWVDVVLISLLPGSQDNYADLQLIFSFQQC